MDREKGARTWAEVQRTGNLNPNIKTIEDYEEQWDINQDKVDAYLEQLPLNQGYLTSKNISDIHKLSYEDLSSYGGEISRTQMKFGPHMGAPPRQMKSELDLLDRQMEKLWDKAQTNEAKTRALAFQHVRLVGIHGFIDGNGRTSRKALQYGMDRNYNLPQLNKIDRADYIKANNSALLHNNIGRLAHLVSEDYGVSYNGTDQQVSPYQVRAFPIEIDLTGDYGLAQSSIQPIENINHENSSKNKWLKSYDLGDLERGSNGKQSGNFHQISDDYNNKIKSPLTVGETVDVFKDLKNSEPFKKKLFKPLNQDVYMEILKKRLEPSIEFSTDEQKEKFFYNVEKQLNGHSKAVDTDKYLESITKSKVPTKIERDIRDRMNPPRVKSLKERAQGNQQSQSRKI
jgi:fido (protein-threonine AMPylation protein)